MFSPTFGVQINLNLFYYISGIKKAAYCDYLFDFVEILNGARSQTWTGTPRKARDFKSLVSTDSTTRAYRQLTCAYYGGVSRSRTELHGFAIQCITALLTRRELERETRLELATPTLARSCSTNWAIPAFAVSGAHFTEIWKAVNHRFKKKNSNV